MNLTFLSFLIHSCWFVCCLVCYSVEHLKKHWQTCKVFFVCCLQTVKRKIKQNIIERKVKTSAKTFARAKGQAAHALCKSTQRAKLIRDLLSVIPCSRCFFLCPLFLLSALHNSVFRLVRVPNLRDKKRFSFVALFVSFCRQFALRKCSTLDLRMQQTALRNVRKSQKRNRFCFNCENFSALFRCCHIRLLLIPNKRQKANE